LPDFFLPVLPDFFLPDLPDFFLLALPDFFLLALPDFFLPALPEVFLPPLADFFLPPLANFFLFPLADFFLPPAPDSLPLFLTFLPPDFFCLVFFALRAPFPDLAFCLPPAMAFLGAGPWLCCKGRHFWRRKKLGTCLPSSIREE
jgi:hypothetical protein